METIGDKIARLDREFVELQNYVALTRDTLSALKVQHMVEAAERRDRLNVLLKRSGRPTLPTISVETFGG